MKKRYWLATGLALAALAGVGLGIFLPEDQPDRWISEQPEWFQWSLLIFGYLTLAYWARVLFCWARRLYRWRQRCRT